MHKAQSLINHVAFVLDASWSMRGKESALTSVADNEIRNLKEQSEKHNQETRVSVYYFGEQTIECLIFDMDVARLPRTGDLYKVLRENTSLIDATLKSQEDLATTSQLYGDHAFLTFVLTDGKENRSRRSAKELENHFFNMADNWSIGFLVPDRDGQSWVENLGILADSVAIWDTTGTAGLDVVGTKVRSATNNFFTARASGVRGTRSVFGTGADAVNPDTVRGNLEFMKNVQKFPVNADTRIDDFMHIAVGYYHPGMGYYQLTKTETIQPNKEILVVDKSNGNVYGGPHARYLIGLPAKTTRVKPDYNPKYDIFVQSTSLNRKLLAGTKVLVKN
jgi:hypothetical protein